MLPRPPVPHRATRWLIVLAGVMIALGIFGSRVTVAGQLPAAQINEAGDTVVLAWNDLGMHCYNPDFQDLAVLPPFNNLFAQVIRVGDPPQLITSGVNVFYGFDDNTYSVGKSNFWDYDQQLFGVDLPPDVGLTGKGLAGEMDQVATHFVADGIPLTEFSDSAPTTADPYQVATVRVVDPATGAELARVNPVAPVSTELHCDNCHYDGGVGGISTGKVETNILTLHDLENWEDYPPGHKTPLMLRRPILCAECHASNALGLPGVPGIPNLSRAIHAKHADEVPNTLQGCYNCHPGPQTQCLRDVMSNTYGMDCIDCHGGMEQVAANPNPWLKEPRCDSCHTDPRYAQNNQLYRLSTEHGGLFCEACHDSTHAVAPSSQPKDAIKFIQLQGHVGTLDTCTVCHATQPTGPGPHGIITQPTEASLDSFDMLKGTVSGGDINSLHAADNDYLSLATAVSGRRQTVTTNVHATSPVTAVSRLDLTLEASATVNNVRLLISLYNFDTNKWQRVGFLNLKTGDKNLTLPNITNANAYVRNSDGRVDVQLSSSGANWKYPDGFTVRLDWLQILLTP